MKLRVPKRIKLWERLWASSVLLYTIAATVVVYKTMTQYGVNWIAFLIIDAITSWTYGIGTARLVVAVIQKNWVALRKWTWIAGVSFITPQLYILTVARHVPRNDYISIALVIGLLAAFALFSLISEVTQARRKAIHSTEES